MFMNEIDPTLAPNQKKKSQKLFAGGLDVLSSPWLNDWWTHIYFFFLRPMLKWLLRKATGKCELLRITYGETDKVQRTIQIENSLKSSSDPELKKLVSERDFNIQEAVKQIISKKNIVSDVHIGFDGKLTNSLICIKSYNKILADAETLRQTKYSSDNEDHESRLLELWAVWKREPLPNRIGEHWGELGFQGHDPMTDFRGMGMLGLEQLIFFAKEYPNQSKQVLFQSHHPKLGFSLAIVGINLTQLGHSLLVERHLRSHFYSLSRAEPDLNDFHEVYCYLLYEFTQFWIAENPRDIMEFNRVRNKFKKRVESQLKSKDSNNCILLSQFQKNMS